MIESLMKLIDDLMCLGLTISTYDEQLKFLYFSKTILNINIILLKLNNASVNVVKNGEMIGKYII